MDINQLPEEFHNFYASFYGDRWPELFDSLQRPEKKVIRWSRLTVSNVGQDHEKITWLDGCSWRDSADEHNITRDNEDLLTSYIMDPASVIAARALPLSGSESVLDMCSAPGGKALILLEALKNGMGTLVVNEPSPSRRERLKKVLRQYVPEELRTRLTVKGVDGLRFGVGSKNSFDAVLVDAPCSGERHLIDNPKESQGWKEARSRTLAKKQYGLLAAAFEALRDQGYILYSTCSISPLENDQVIARLLKKKSGLVQVHSTLDPSGLSESTEFGRIFLPDTSGYGPLYFCLLQKGGG